MANIWVIIGGIAAIIGALAIIAVWFKGSMDKMSSAAYEKGKHSERHETLDGDIHKAHRRLDAVEDDVTELKGSIEANVAVHESMMMNQADLSSRFGELDRNVNGRLDKILEILVSNK